MPESRDDDEVMIGFRCLLTRGQNWNVTCTEHLKKKKKPMHAFAVRISALFLLIWMPFLLSSVYLFDSDVS